MASFPEIVQPVAVSSVTEPQMVSSGCSYSFFGDISLPACLSCVLILFELLEKEAPREMPLEPEPESQYVPEAMVSFLVFTELFVIHL